jgi:hypothetical protein
VVGLKQLAEAAGSVTSPLSVLGRYPLRSPYFPLSTKSEERDETCPYLGRQIIERGVDHDDCDDK